MLDTMETYQNNNDMNYHLLRAAINLFGKGPSELEPAQLDKVVMQASKEVELEQLVLDSAEARDVHIPESVLRDSVKQVENGYPDKETYLSDLDDNGLDEAAFKEAIQRELKVNTVLERVSSRHATITEMDCMLFYYMHKDKFSQPETRTARHILITINNDYEENTLEAVKDKMAVIRKRVSAKPRRFVEQATKHSECPTAMNGGLLGKLPKGQLYPELDEVLFNMQAGTISDVVESELGFHILYCEQIHPAGPVSFKEAVPRIREKLTKRRMRMCQKSWLAELKEQAQQGDNDDE